MEVSVRVSTLEDASFLRDMFFEVRAPEFIAAGLVGLPLETLLSQQYVAMRTHYDREYAHAVYEVFELAGERIGYQATVVLDSLHLIDISLVMRMRGNGIGTAQLKQLQRRATEMELPMTLTVEKFNPAMRLYERLGFKPYMDSEVYSRMKWEA
jgi:ribosomal protein S18 acetylase RimI-like enzyme